MEHLVTKLHRAGDEECQQISGLQATSETSIRTTAEISFGSCVKGMWCRLLDTGSRKGEQYALCGCQNEHYMGFIAISAPLDPESKVKNIAM